MKTLERMIIASARLLEDNKAVFVGTGMPLLASIVAQRLYAPNLVIVYEGGGVGGQPQGRLPIQVTESLTFHRGIMVGSVHEVFSMAQAGLIEFGFLGGAQVDPYGNLNTTVIGAWDRPKARLPGSGGGADIASGSWRNIILMTQDARKFVPQVDFITSPGYLTGPGAREAAGLAANSGPYRVVTQLGIYGFPEQTRRMTLFKTFAGVKVPEDIEAASGFDIPVASDLTVEPDPTEEELEVLYSLDPWGIVLEKR